MRYVFLLVCMLELYIGLLAAGSGQQGNSIIDAVTREHGFEGAHVGVILNDLKTGKRLAFRNADKWFTPASCTKLWTTLAALDCFGSRKRFATSVYTPSRIKHGVVDGPIVLYGRGDPLLTFDGLCTLAQQLWNAGIRTIAGDIIADGSYFSEKAIHPDTEFGDLQWYFAAPLSALSVGNNAVKVTLTPRRAGQGAQVAIDQHIPYMRITNTVRVVRSKRNAEGVAVSKQLGSNHLHLSGSLAVGEEPQQYTVALSHVDQYAGLLFAQALNYVGIRCAGAVYTRKVSKRGMRECARLLSPDMANLITEVNKKVTILLLACYERI